MSTKDFNISRDEFRNITRCLDNEEFRALFMEYCNDLRDNRKQYEEELSILEAERGYDVKFLKPSPGYVIKTIIDGKRKGFINVCQSELVQKPSSTSGVNEDGTKGLKWSIPYAQTQPRKDYDNKRVECVVYDVMFHPDSLHLASKNDGFRKLLNDTSLDAVEKSFKVKLDRVNLRFPKLQYKGTPSSSVVREKLPHCDTLPKDELFEKLLPPLPASHTSMENGNTGGERCTKAENKENIKRTAAAGAGDSFYTTPEYKIVQRRDIEYGEMTNELDAKIDVTIPRELKIVITLPLLKSTNECALDVTKTTLHLVSEKPAKYKLELKLPYEVSENEGKASFNVDERQLTVTVPVLRKRNITLQDINSVNAPATIAKDSAKLIENVNILPNADCTSQGGDSKTVPSVMVAPRKTIFPKFSVNKMENLLAFTLNVRNVDPNTIELENRTDSVHCRFANIGNGYFPCYYVFFVRFPNALVTEVLHEEWDNNLIIQITLNTPNVSCYQAGPDENETVEYSIMEDITDKINKFGKEIEDDSLCIAVVRQGQSCAKVKSSGLMSIEITKREEADQLPEVETEKEEEGEKVRPIPEALSATSAEEGDDKESTEAEKARSMLKAKRNSRKKKKERSLSDSFCDHLKVIVENEAASGSYVDQSSDATEQPTAASKAVDSPDSKGRKTRSLSECCPLKESDGGEDGTAIPTLTRKYKGILKRSSYDRSISECSSVDDLGTSVELARSMGEECRKTVRFNNSIRKQLFRSNSCILSMKKKTMKRKEAQRRQDARRMSEGESTDNDEKDTRHRDEEHCSSSDQHDEKDAIEDDSGVSFDSESGDKETVAPKGGKNGRPKTASKRKNNNKGTKSADAKQSSGKKHGSNGKNIDFKSDMIFDIEI
uniref:Protein kintoun n=1 Tax=Anopheles farauti TaxID=69004 RepID=A0A182QDY3_9DIPT